MDMGNAKLGITNEKADFSRQIAATHVRVTAFQTSLNKPFSGSGIGFQEYRCNQIKEFFHYEQMDRRFGTVCHVGHTLVPEGENAANRPTACFGLFSRFRNVRGVEREETARAAARILRCPRTKPVNKTAEEKARPDGVFLLSSFV